MAGEHLPGAHEEVAGAPPDLPVGRDLQSPVPAREENHGGLGAGRLEEEQALGDAGARGDVDHAFGLRARRPGAEKEAEERRAEAGGPHVRGVASDSAVNEKKRRAAVWFS